MAAAHAQQAAAAMAAAAAAAAADAQTHQPTLNRKSSANGLSTATTGSWTDYNLTYLQAKTTCFYCDELSISLLRKWP